MDPSQSTNVAAAEERQPPSRLNRYHVVLYIVIIAVFVVMTKTFLLLRMRWEASRLLRHHPGDPEASFCCPDVLHRLSKASNVNIDPCSDFYKFTCYNWDIREKTSFPEKVMLQAVTTPTYTGLITSPAGKAIVNLYRSCLNAVAGKDSGLRRAVAAVIHTLDPPVLPTPLQMLHLLCRMIFRYTLSPGLDILVTEKYITFTLLNDAALVWEAKEAFWYREQALAVFNEIMSTNVSWDNLKAQVSSLFARHNCTENMYSEVSVLTDIFPSLSLEAWNETLNTYSGMVLPESAGYCADSSLKNYSRIVIEGVQPTSLALVVVEASVDSWARFFRHFHDVLTVNMICEPLAEEQGILWDTVVTETFQNRQKDDILRQIYAVIADEVLGRVGAIFPPEDLALMEEIVRNCTIFFPSDLHLADVRVPTLTPDYWWNAMALENYRREVRAVQTAHGIPHYVYGEFRKHGHVVAAENGIIVPPSLYTSTVITPWPEVVVNMPTIGPKIAATMWERIIYNPLRYSERTRKILESTLQCLWNADHFVFRRIYIEDAVNAARTPLLNQTIVSWEGRNISRAHLFYMNYVFNNFCSGSQNVAGVPPSSVNGILARASDFVDAFGCSPRPNASTSCNL